MVDTERIRVMTDSDAISWIDEEEDRIFRHILALRAIRNSVAPAINRLPDEIISRIMILYKSLHLRIEGSFERSWEKITLVCRWWRSVAVKTAVLWTDIDFGHKSGAVAYLSRSRNAHLYVRVRIDGRSSPNGAPQRFMEMLIPHSTRIVAFVAYVQPTQLETLAPLLSSPFPKLQTLSVTVSGLLGHSDAPRILPNISNPHSLRTVSLYGVYIPPDSRILRGLRKLELHDQQLHDAFPSPEEFLNLLDRNPQLSSLTISRSDNWQLPQNVIQKPWPQRRIVPKFLRSLTLDIERRQTVKFLSHVRVPKSTTITITCRLFDLLMENVHDFSAVLPRRQDNRLECLPIIDRVTVEYSSITDIEVTAFEGKRTCLQVYLEDVSSVDAPDVVPSFYATIGKAFQFSPVTHLSLEFDDPTPTEDEWFSLLSYFPALNCLDVKYSSESVEPSGPTLWEALGDSRTAGEFVCPGLISVKVTRMVSSEGFNQSLVSCLQRRIQNGLPKLNHLQLSGMLWGEGAEIEWPNVEEYVAEFLHH